MRAGKPAQLKSPLLLTTTFGLEACIAALIRHARPVALTCGDAEVNDIQAMAMPSDTAGTSACPRFWPAAPHHLARR
ncbi:hypothetical protein ACFOD4_10595 [Pseudoroseomonas globiformis]|uniref:Uncharacterized protein n=1 Tax=Teichococcus globiformis TaxID=2307229 RepID=A0ABV7G1X9_9PROT